MHFREKTRPKTCGGASLKSMLGIGKCYDLDAAPLRFPRISIVRIARLIQIQLVLDGEALQEGDKGTFRALGVPRRHGVPTMSAIGRKGCRRSAANLTQHATTKRCLSLFTAHKVSLKITT